MCYLPTKGGEVITEQLLKENVNISFLLSKERDIRLRVFPETEGYFYYEVAIEDKYGSYNDHSSYSIDIGVSSEKTDNSDESCCKFHQI